ncbi:MAG: helix-hairpin-helix domain-containing protein [Methylococcaceae bacterium]|jgi:competence protein ComEA helix-hairpin-helix repeat region
MKLFVTLCTLLFAANLSAAPVNINTADAKTISDSLSGIGAKKAEAIVKYRQENGQFKTPEDLTKVSGIGDKTVQKNLNDILVSDAQPSPDNKKK